MSPMNESNQCVKHRFILSQYPGGVEGGVMIVHWGMAPSELLKRQHGAYCSAFQNITGWIAIQKPYILIILSEGQHGVCMALEKPR